MALPLLLFQLSSGSGAPATPRLVSFTSWTTASAQTLVTWSTSRALRTWSEAGTVTTTDS